MIADLSKLNIGYVGYSDNLEHPADRRRLASWAQDRQVTLNTSRPLESDLLVMTNAANFKYWVKRANQPIILDLVDGYLGENPWLAKDVARNILRSLSGASTLGWLTYTRHLKFACQNSNAVVVASIEQKRLVEHLNPNVWVIQDNHVEIDLEREIQHDSVFKSKKHLFWEGLGYTLKHFKVIAGELDSFLFKEGWGLYLLTVEEFPRWGAKYGKVKTKKLIESMFPLAHKQITVIPWTINNLVAYSKVSDFAIIPINPNDKFALLKPENKLLSMWHLGLPTLCSVTPAYKRLENELASFKFCVELKDWHKALLDFASKDKEWNMSKVAINKFIQSKHSNSHVTDQWELVIRDVISNQNSNSDSDGMLR